MRFVACILAANDWSWLAGVIMLVVFGILGAIGKKIQKKAEEEQARKNQQRVRDISRGAGAQPQPSRRMQPRPMQPRQSPLPQRLVMQAPPIIKQVRMQVPPPLPRAVRAPKPAKPVRRQGQPVPVVQEEEEVVRRTVIDADQPMGMGKGPEQAVAELKFHASQVAEQLPHIEALPAAHAAIGAQQRRPQPRQVQLVTNVASQTEAMKAIILAEILGKPKALRQEPEAWQP